MQVENKASFHSLTSTLHCTYTTPILHKCLYIECETITISTNSILPFVPHCIIGATQPPTSNRLQDLLFQNCFNGIVPLNWCLCILQDRPALRDCLPARRAGEELR